MNIFESEADLLSALDKHDVLIRRCAAGDLDVDAFLQAYNNFYLYSALDGHESDEKERLLLSKHIERILPHKMICDEVIFRLTSEEHALNEKYKKSGFIGRGEAKERIQKIASTYLDLK